MENVLLDVFEEHLNEAGFLWTQWEQALDAPDFSFEESLSLEGRLRAHLDGLVVGDAPVVELLLTPSLDSEDPSLIFSATFALLAAPGNTRPLEALATGLEGPEELRPSIQRAWELSEGESMAQSLKALLARTHANPLAMSLEVLAFHHLTPRADVVEGLLGSADARLLAAASGWLQALPPQRMRTLLARLLRDSRPEVLDAAIEAGLMAGARTAWDRCLEEASANASPSRHQLLLLGLGGDSTSLARLLGLLGEERLLADVLWALGFSGQPAAAEACLAWLEHPRFAPLAGESFSAITGLSLRDDFALEREEAPREEPIPLEEEDLDADLTPRPEDALPIPNPGVVRAWWQHERKGFTAGQRYLRGKPFSMERLLAELELGPMRRRHAHALELALRSRGALRLQTRAFSPRQNRELASMRTGAFRLSSRPLPGLLEGW